MSRLTDLIAQAKKQDPRLGAALEREFHSRTERTFGLVFERHLTEEVELPGRPVRRGDIVHVLPERGSNERNDPRNWLVITTYKDAEKARLSQLVEYSPATDTQPEFRSNVPVTDLVVVAQQDDVIYPGLRQTGEVLGSDNPDSPFHSIINAENYHALKMLTYTHYHRIDCIYIDPPYNTGAKDWKYNNDYVDSEDTYRHSKWLSFMSRRLLVAKQLLNPKDSVLIVTIDEKEYLRLGLLLEQTFPEARIQMVSSVINPSGSQRKNMFWRTDEYIFFVMFGAAAPTRWTSDMSAPTEKPKKKRAIWNSLRRRGSGNSRSHSPGCFYPVYVRDGRIVKVGDTLSAEQNPGDEPSIDGAFAVYPIKEDGTQSRNECTPEFARALLSKGYLRYKEHNGKGTIQYLRESEIRKIDEAAIVRKGTTKFGYADLAWNDEVAALINAKTQWALPSHDADQNGSRINRLLLPGRKFPFPKSLYAVEDALRFFVKDKPYATILDFFAGSGTTAHAVMRLNKQDGGLRRSISVTNNEVGVDEQEKLRAQGLRPGDAEWEKWGICDYVTKPRIEAAITGKTPEGTPVKGDYKFTDEFPMADGFEANARFFTLTYEPPTRVRHGYAFQEIAPMLWLRAGQVGRIITKIPDCGWDIAESYGVIENVAASKQFLHAVNEQNGIKIIYIATNDDLVFESMAREMAETKAELVRLYSTYLNNFSFQQARENNN